MSKELGQKIQDLSEEVTGHNWEPERVREIASLLLDALAEIAAMPEKIPNASGGFAAGKGIMITALKAQVLEALTRNDEDYQRRQAVRGAVCQAVTNSMLYPEKIQHHILGMDMSKVIDAVTEAVMGVPFAESVKTEEPKTPARFPGGTKFRYMKLDGTTSGTLNETEAWQKFLDDTTMGHLEVWAPEARVWKPIQYQVPPEFEFRVVYPDGGGVSNIKTGADALALVKKAYGTTQGMAQTRVKGSNDPWIPLEGQK